MMTLAGAGGFDLVVIGDLIAERHVAVDDRLEVREHFLRSELR